MFLSCAANSSGSLRIYFQAIHVSVSVEEVNSYIRQDHSYRCFLQYKDSPQSIVVHAAHLLTLGRDALPPQAMNFVINLC